MAAYAGSLANNEIARTLAPKALPTINVVRTFLRSAALSSDNGSRA
jgi:hypothetical protein